MQGSTPIPFVGTNMNLQVAKKIDSAIAELNIPQRTPYLKISLIY